MTKTKQWDLWTEILAARAKAHEKHGSNSIEAIRADDPRWLSILVEEVGEVAHAQTYDADPRDASVRAELVDVAAVATAWIDSLDRAERLRAPLGYLSGPPGSCVPQYESGPVPVYPEGGPKTCPNCDGDGYVDVRRWKSTEMVSVACWECQGDGEVS